MPIKKIRAHICNQVTNKPTAPKNLFSGYSTNASYSLELKMSLLPKATIVLPKSLSANRCGEKIKLNAIVNPIIDSKIISMTNERPGATLATVLSWHFIGPLN